MFADLRIANATILEPCTKKMNWDPQCLGPTDTVPGDKHILLPSYCNPPAQV